MEEDEAEDSTFFNDDLPSSSEDTTETEPTTTTTITTTTTTTTSRRLPRGINFLKKVSPLVNNVVRVTVTTTTGDDSGHSTPSTPRNLRRDKSKDNQLQGNTSRSSFLNLKSSFKNTNFTYALDAALLASLLQTAYAGGDRMAFSLHLFILLATLIFPGPGSLIGLIRFLIMYSLRLSIFKNRQGNQMNQESSSAVSLLLLALLNAAAVVNLHTLREWKSLRYSTWTKPNLKFLSGNNLQSSSRLYGFIVFVLGAMFFMRCTIRLMIVGKTRLDIGADWIFASPYLMVSGLSGWLGPTRSTSRIKIIHHAFAFICVALVSELVLRLIS